MSLPVEAMQTLRHFSEMTAGRPEGDRFAKHDEARQVIKGLKITLDDLPDKHLACVSYVIATLMSTLLVLPVPDLAATLDKSAGAYSLASAALLGLYDLTPGSATEASDTRAPAHAYLLSAWFATCAPTVERYTAS